MEQVIDKVLVSAEMNTFTVQCGPPTTAGDLEVCFCTEQLWNLMPDTITIMLQTLGGFDLFIMGNSLHMHTKGLSRREIRWSAMCKALRLEGL